MTANPYKNCMLCPRRCKADRTLRSGFCGMGADIMAARAGLHFYEEPFLSGTCGSGTVFFSGCSLGCVYCQNSSISSGHTGFRISEERLSEIFIEQQQRGAHNINIVTGTHFTPSIAAALKSAKEAGLSVPVIWNSSAYELPETLKMLDGLIDIWLPDFKTRSHELSARYMNAPGYPEAAEASLDYMVRSCGAPVFDSSTKLMTRGVVVRHLVIPGNTKDSKNVLRYLYKTYKDSIWISVMSQYTPLSEMPYPELNRTVTSREYNSVISYALDLGITNALIQEGESAGESFIPVFDGTGL